MMRRLSASLLTAVALTMGAAAAEPDSLSRAVAVFMASNFKIAVENALGDLRTTGLDVDTTAVKALLLDELARPYNANEHRDANAFIEQAIERHARAESDALLARAAAAPGAQVLDDGLVLETLSEGSGASPTPESTVAMRYAVSLPDGTVFDSIGPDEAPMVTAVKALTPGMAIGLTHMKPGGNYRLTVPPALGYGKEGVPGVIPPDCALQFVVELVEVK